MSEMISRKDFFKSSAKYAAGIAAGMAGVSMLKPGDTIAGTKATWPIAYTALDVEAVREYAHTAFHAPGGCGYGSFEGVIGYLRDTQGGDFDNIPTDMMRWGGAGGAGWGTLCGTLIGASAAINLCVSSDASKLISELFGWYCETALPTDQTFYSHDGTKEASPQSDAGSPLCHVSVARWVVSSGLAGNSPERGERCSRLTGDIAAKAAELLNAHLAGTFAATYEDPTEDDGCITCHTEGLGDAPTMAEIKMNCVQCHGDYETIHQITTDVVKDGIVPFGFSISQNYPNPFNPTTTISFEVDKAAPASIKVYNIQGQEVRSLLTENIQPGTHKLSWDGKDNRGVSVASGVYIVRLTSGRRVTSARMTLLK